jgi:hypothetical protein
MYAWPRDSARFEIDDEGDIVEASLCCQLCQPVSTKEAHLGAGRHRTQEVAGSSPASASSIGSLCKRGCFLAVAATRDGKLPVSPRLRFEAVAG